MSFAKAWILLSKEVAHSHQRELETGRRQTLETVVVGRITELASERVKLPSCHGGLGLRTGQLENAQQRRIGRLAICTLQCCQGRAQRYEEPMPGGHPELLAGALARSIMLVSGVAVGLRLSVSTKLRRVSWRSHGIETRRLMTL